MQLNCKSHSCLMSHESSGKTTFNMTSPLLLNTQEQYFTQEVDNEGFVSLSEEE